MESHEHGECFEQGVLSATSKGCYETGVPHQTSLNPVSLCTFPQYLTPLPHRPSKSTQTGESLCLERHADIAWKPFRLQQFKFRPPADCCRAVEMINGIKFAVSGAAQDNLGIAADEVGLHSVHSSLALAKEPGYTIMLVGRWPCLH